ncbi:MAG: hypothetical protein K6B69_08155 [Lachnospiraceae bacterium]|nr:hypothetical protein [Lachnospiraceae bacterium]
MYKFKFIKSNKGSSLILVAALTVVIIGVTVSLRIMAGIIMASANQQLNQDQAYELATSLGNALEERILNGDGTKKTMLELRDGATLVDMSGFEGMPDASVMAKVTSDGNGRYVLQVTSEVGEAKYLWTATYQGSASAGYSK